MRPFIPFTLIRSFAVAVIALNLGCGQVSLKRLDRILPTSTGSTPAQGALGNLGFVKYTNFLTNDLSTSYDDLFAVAIQSDGKIVAAGSSTAKRITQFALVRLNSDGSMDTSFNSTGQVLTSFGQGKSAAAYAVKLQSDGKIVAVGLADGNGSSDIAVARYNTDGSLDTSFNSTGMVTIDIDNNSNDFGNAVQIQSDGKIVVAGRAESASMNITLVRYNSDGSLDTSFNGTGIVITDLGGFSQDNADALEIQGDGKLVIAGYANTNGNPSDFMVARYNTDGSLDTSFHAVGYVLTDTGGGQTDTARALQIQGDGKIVAAGSSFNGGNWFFSMARYDSSGNLDTTFNGTGIVSTLVSTYSYGMGLGIESTGKLVIVGQDFDFAVAQYNSNGSLDTTFNTVGTVTTHLGASAFGRGVGIQANDKIVMVGTTGVGGGTDFAVIRYNTDGSLDTTFNSTGYALIPVAAESDDWFAAMQLQSDDKLIQVGWSGTSDTDYSIARYNADGSLDTTFNGTGLARVDIASNHSDQAMAVQTQSDGKIVVAGNTLSASIDFSAARFNDDGTLDTSFNGTGSTVVSLSSSSGGLTGMQIQSNGKIVMGGAANTVGTSDVLLARLNSNGSLDTTFNGTGLVQVKSGAWADDYMSTLSILSDGKIVVAGISTDGNALTLFIMRLNSDGSADTSFNGTGTVLTTLSANYFDTYNYLQPLDDGKLLVATSSDINGSVDLLLMRLNADGSLDSTFNGTGKLYLDLGSSSQDYAAGLQMQSDGKIVLAADSDASGSFGAAVVRLNADGSYDSSFNTTGKLFYDFGTGVNAIVSTLNIHSNGKLSLGGYSDIRGRYDYMWIQID